MLVAIVVIILVVIPHHSGSGPVQTILKKIPGCGSIWTASGDSFDDNTISEGGCDLSDGISLRIYVWAAGDTSDQHDYAYWVTNCVSSYPPPLNAPDGCYVGSNPTPWFIDISTSNFAMSGAESYWTPVENALSGLRVTKAPLSWCSNYCPIPGQPSGSGGFDFGDSD